MVKTIWHWRNICKYIISAFFVIGSWGCIAFILISIFNIPFLISLPGGLIGGLLVGIIFSFIFSEKYPLYHFE